MLFSPNFVEMSTLWFNASFNSGFLVQCYVLIVFRIMTEFERLINVSLTLYIAGPIMIQTGRDFNLLGSEQNGWHFEDIFIFVFCFIEEIKFCLNFFPLKSNWAIVRDGSGNGFVLNKQQAIACTSVDSGLNDTFSNLDIVRCLPENCVLCLISIILKIQSSHLLLCCMLLSNQDTAFAKPGFFFYSQ